MRQFHHREYDTSHIDISGFHSIGTFVAEHMLHIQSHYPIIGDNAYRHTSGGHTNAMIQDPTVYHPFDPVSVG
jgi:2-isopropylmalate synthase